jgi:hypothetical protein
MVGGRMPSRGCRHQRLEHRVAFAAQQLMSDVDAQRENRRIV